jgi:hypothetical protein
MEFTPFGVWVFAQGQVMGFRYLLLAGLLENKHFVCFQPVFADQSID